jgi:hypothetical protein
MPSRSPCLCDLLPIFGMVFSPFEATSQSLFQQNHHYIKRNDIVPHDAHKSANQPRTWIKNSRVAYIRHTHT